MSVSKTSIVCGASYPHCRAARNYESWRIIMSPPTLINVLRATLERIENSGEVDPSDPAFIELKRSVTLAMAEFEVAKSDLEVANSAKSAIATEPPLLETT